MMDNPHSICFIIINFPFKYKIHSNLHLDFIILWNIIIKTIQNVNKTNTFKISIKSYPTKDYAIESEYCT